MSTLWPKEYTGGSHQGATDGAYAHQVRPLAELLQQFGWPYDSQYRKQALEYLQKAEQRREEQKRGGAA